MGPLRSSLGGRVRSCLQKKKITKEKKNPFPADVAKKKKKERICACLSNNKMFCSDIQKTRSKQIKRLKFAILFFNPLQMTAPFGHSVHKEM